MSSLFSPTESGRREKYKCLIIIGLKMLEALKNVLRFINRCFICYAMFKKILVATDGSPASDRAVETVLKMKLQNPEIEVSILHVSESPSKTVMEPSIEQSSKLIVLPDSTRISLIREKDEILERARMMAEEMGVKARLLSRVGDPASVIVEEAEKGNYDLVVVGGEGLGKSGRFLGSVASRVVNRFRGSVLVIR